MKKVDNTKNELDQILKSKNCIVFLFCEGMPNPQETLIELYMSQNREEVKNYHPLERN